MTVGNYCHLPQVNGRLETQEKEGKDGDPAFPKQQWPPAHVCPLCHMPFSQVSHCYFNQTVHVHCAASRVVHVTFTLLVVNCITR